MKRTFKHPNFYLGAISLILAIALLCAGNVIFGLMAVLLWYVLWEDEAYNSPSVFNCIKKDLK